DQQAQPGDMKKGRRSFSEYSDRYRTISCAMWLGSSAARRAVPPGLAGTVLLNAATAGRPWRTRIETAGQYLASLLQCGHGWAAVENRCHWRRVPRLPWLLQCGHGWAAVENTTSLPSMPDKEQALQCG